MGNLEEFKKTVWIFLSVSHSLEQKENKMLCCNQIMFSEALCWQVHNSFTTSTKTQILGREWQHFQMERSGAQKHQVSHSQLPTWPREKIFLFLLKVKLALTDGGAGAQPGPWHWGVNLFLLPRTFPSNPANPCNISYATLTHQPQQELTVMSQLKPVKVYGNTQLTLLRKRENFESFWRAAPIKLWWKVQQSPWKTLNVCSWPLTCFPVVWVVFLTSPNKLFEIQAWENILALSQMQNSELLWTFSRSVLSQV